MFWSAPSFHPDSLPDLTGKTYIVTGATSGIGLHTAGRLAEHGAHVYLCARSQAKADKAIDTIKTAYPNPAGTTKTIGKLSTLVMDHDDLSSIAAAAKTFLAQESQLHGLVNNAGIMATPRLITNDGYEEQWQTNHLAHWVFTHHLLPILRKTAASEKANPGAVRIVNLTSVGHTAAPQGGIDLADTTLGDAGTGLSRYGQSKLANILHAKVLHEKYGPGSPPAAAGEGEIWVSAVHPGLVQTNLGERASAFPPMVLQLAKWYSALGGARDAASGAFTSLYCAASTDFTRDMSGRYFQPVAKFGNESAYAKDMELARKLEAWTEGEMRKRGWLE